MSVESGRKRGWKNEERNREERETRRAKGERKKWKREERKRETRVREDGETGMDSLFLETTKKFQGFDGEKERTEVVPKRDGQKKKEILF